MRGGALRMLAIVVLGLAWITSSQPIALYDGVGFPDEVYRYVDPPAGTPPTPAATTAVFSTRAHNGTSEGDVYVGSAETGPQVQLLMPAASISTPPDASTITVTATPLAPAVQPSGATIDGNVYRIAGQANVAGDLKVTIGTGALLLRGTTARQPGPLFFFRPDESSPWQPLETNRAGQDVYQTTITGFGDFALAFQNGSGQGAQSTAAAPAKSAAGWVLAGLAVFLIGCLVAIRIIRRRPAGGAR